MLPLDDIVELYVLMVRRVYDKEVSAWVPHTKDGKIKMYYRQSHVKSAITQLDNQRRWNRTNHAYEYRVLMLSVPIGEWEEVDV